MSTPGPNTVSDISWMGLIGIEEKLQDILQQEQVTW